MVVERSGRAPRLEMVSFKKLSVGTLALGVVFKVKLAILSTHAVDQRKSTNEG